MVYAPAMVAGLIAMGPAAVFGEKKNIPKQIFLISIVLFLASFLIMGFTTSSTIFVIGVVFFFIAFNMMEPLVQSMISKFAKVHQKGAALGISNSAAYFATFLGGTFAGLYLDISDRETLSITLATIITLWLVWTTLKLQNPKRHSHLYISNDEINFDKLNALESEHIAEWYINETENIVVIKYVMGAIEENDLKAKVSK
jgi:MFS family permease